MGPTPRGTAGVTGCITWGPANVPADGDAGGFGGAGVEMGGTTLVLVSVRGVGAGAVPAGLAGVTGFPETGGGAAGLVSFTAGGAVILSTAGAGMFSGCSALAVKGFDEGGVPGSLSARERTAGVSRAGARAGNFGSSRNRAAGQFRACGRTFSGGLAM